MTMRDEEKAHNMFPEIFGDPRMVDSSEYHHLMELAGEIIDNKQAKGASKNEIRQTLVSVMETVEGHAGSIREQLRDMNIQESSKSTSDDESETGSSMGH